MTRLLHTRRGIRVLALLTSVVAVLGSVAAASSGDGGGGGSRPLVITAEAQRRTLQDSVTVKGTVERVEQRQIQAVAPGQITDVAIDDGTEVAAGTALLALDGRSAIAVPGEFPFFRPLDVGSRGEDVRQLETVLSGAGYHPGPVDDLYTEATRTALAQWQAAHRYPGATPEHAETVTVSLTPSNGYTIGDQSAAAVAIQPGRVRAASSSEPVYAAAATDNPRLSIYAVDAVVAEGGTATFRIDAHDVPTDATEIEVEVDGTTNELDILAPPGTITLAADTWSATVSIPVREDRSVEGDETIVVRLVDDSGYSVDSSQDEATMTVVDDDLPELTLAGGGIAAEGQRQMITIEADQAPERDVQIGLTVTGDAVSRRDYAPIDPYVVLPSGMSSVEVPVTTLTDDTLEDDERIIVTLTPNLTQYAVGAAGVAVVTISQAAGNAGLPVVTLRPTATSVDEGQSFPLVASLDRPLTQDLVLELGYAGSAVANADFTPLGRVVVPAGQTSLNLQVPTVEDGRVEGDRQLVISLLPSAAYRVGSPSTGTATIESDDIPELTLLAGSHSVGEGAGTAFRIVADQAPDGDVSVSYSALGSATSGEDFESLTGTAILRAGQTEVAVPLLTLADDVSFLPTDMITGEWPVRVGQVLVDEGDPVVAGTPLLSLTDSGLTVILRATASDRTRLQTGQPVKVTLSGSSAEAEGVITELDETAQVDEATEEQFYEGTVDVEELDAADGANVAIEVILDQREDALTVPIAAVKQDGGGNDVVRVLDLDAAGETREVEVVTGISEGSYIEITKGLDGGEVVIVEVETDE